MSRKRTSLADLASRGSHMATPSLARVMPAAASGGDIPVAAFQSFSSKGNDIVYEKPVTDVLDTI